ncbi:MAG: S41 family peptidase [Pseudomonadota bacterium]
MAGRFLAAMLAVFPAASLADVSVPDTPPGRALSAWLDAFNSGDRARLESFTRTYAPGVNPDDYLGWREEVGGYDLLEIYSSDRTNVFFRVKARTNPVEEAGRVTMSAADPKSVSNLGTWRIPPGGRFEAVALDAAARHKLVERVAETFDRFYVIPEIGKQMAAALRKHDAHGDYRSMRFGDDFATKVTEELQAISHDKHVEVRFSYFVRPDESPAKRAEREARQLVANNCGFEKAKYLRPNVGYLKFNMFADTGVCAPTASAAMAFLADSDALILDLRDNHGGGGGMVEFMASYLFEERTHLDDLFTRGEPAAKESWTLQDVPGRKFIGKPVFVLISGRTFSAAEALSYYLKSLKRATLIGEPTPGGGHVTETKPIDDHFMVRVPYGRSINPVTKGSWEGTGVEPDIKITADQALDAALKLAAEAISKNR